MDGLPALRPAMPADVPALEHLIARSAAGLSAGFYSSEQIEAVTREVFGVDTQLVVDGTYFMVEVTGKPVACGGWSRRSTGYGGDKMKAGQERLLDPALDAAKIRAFFVDPDAARCGLGSMLLQHCTTQAAAAGFRELELTATLPGVPLYRARGFVEIEHFDLLLAQGAVKVPLVLMRRPIA